MQGVAVLVKIDAENQSIANKNRLFLSGQPNF